MGLVPCGKCRRHIRTPTSGCPFCGALPTVPGLVSLAAAATLVLASCGSTAPPDPTSSPKSPSMAIDAGVTDAAIDAGAGVVDAGVTPVDAAAVDAGSVDAGVARPRPRPIPKPRPQPLYGIDRE